MIEPRHQVQDTAHLFRREDDRQLELRVGASQFHFLGPRTVEGLFPEHLDGADGLRAGLAGNFLMLFEMDAVLAEVFGREQVGGLVVMLTQLAKAGVVGLLGAGTDGQEFQIIGKGF